MCPAEVVKRAAIPMSGAMLVKVVASFILLLAGNVINGLQ